MLFRDTFTPLNTLGFCLCAVGILVYNVHKVRVRVGVRVRVRVRGILVYNVHKVGTKSD